jgi:putative transposase
MTRGNRKGLVFEDDRDRVRFTDILSEAVKRYAVRVFAECRLGNHYHQVVQTPRANLPGFMGYVNGGFTQYSNYRHQRIGHLFNGPYKPILVDNAYYLRVATGYVVMNPVNHGFVDAPEEWKWSSYRATVGLEAAPEYLCLDWLDDAFPATSRSESQERFREYLTARTWAEGEDWLTKPAAGSTEFERDLREHIGATLFMAALPKSYRLVNRPPLSDLFSSTMRKEERNKQMLRAHVIYAYSLSEIARALCMHPGSVSRIVASLRRVARHRG